MLDVLRLPSPLLEPGEQPPVPIAQEPPQRRVPTPHPLHVFGAFIFCVLWRRAARRADVRVTAVTLREMIEHLGGLWIKVGQLLSLRADIFPQEVCRELGRLQYRALGFPFEAAKAVIEAELRMPLARVFSRF